MKKIYLIIGLLFGAKVGYADDNAIIKSVINTAAIYKGDHLDTFLKTRLEYFQNSVKSIRISQSLIKDIKETIEVLKRMNITLSKQQINLINQIIHIKTFNSSQILSINNIFHVLRRVQKSHEHEINNIFKLLENIVKHSGELSTLCTPCTPRNIGLIIPESFGLLKFNLNAIELRFVEQLIFVKNNIEMYLKSDKIVPRKANLISLFNEINLKDVGIEENDFSSLLSVVEKGKGNKDTNLKVKHLFQVEGDEKTKACLKAKVVNILNEKIHLLLFHILVSRNMIMDSYEILFQSFIKTMESLENKVYETHWNKLAEFLVEKCKEVRDIYNTSFDFGISRLRWLEIHNGEYGNDLSAFKPVVLEDEVIAETMKNDTKLSVFKPVVLEDEHVKRKVQDETKQDI